MDTRRQFIQKLFAGTVTGLLAQEGFSASGIAYPALFKPGGQDPDWEAIRSQFRLPEDHVYLNSATIGLMPTRVLDRIWESLIELQMGRYGSPPGLHDSIAKAFGCAPQEVAFTQNTTQGINVVAQGLHLKRGDEIILTDQEHAGNAIPWLARAKRDGLCIRILSPEPDDDRNLENLEALVTKRTKVIALPHITCTTGQVLPIQAISEAFSARVPYLFFDGAHGAGSLELNLKSIGCGFYSTCGHKWLCGPAGSGFLYVNESLLNDLKPIFCGAGSEIGWEASTQRQSLGNWKAGAERFEYGTQNKVVQAGFLAALDFQSEIGLRNISNRLRELNSLLRTKLQALEWLEILTPSLSQQHVGILTIRPKEAMRRPAFVEYMKSRSGFRVREVQESSLQAVRISTHIFNSEKDIENLSSYVSEWKP